MKKLSLMVSLTLAFVCLSLHDKLQSEHWKEKTSPNA